MGSRHKGGGETKVEEEEAEEKQHHHQQQQPQGEKKAKAAGFLLVDKVGGGPSTPPPTWRLELSSHEGDDSLGPTQQFLANPLALRGSTVSARKLCASLWEVQPPYHSFAMNRRAHKPKRDKGFDFDAPSVPHEQPAMGAGLSKSNLASPLRPQKYRGNNHAGEPVSSASYCSSMEVGPYKPPDTPVTSVDWRDQSVESSHSLRTSSELLKILNRIWSLEEQHASNSSLAKALKSELIRSRARIKELLKEKQKDQLLVEDMMKQVEQDRLREVEAAVKSLREELEEERKLRRFSESERRKSSKELSVLKSGFSTVLRELDRERKARRLLESLCDEFAEGIRDYDLVVRSLKHKVSEDTVSVSLSGQSILHISEAWIDERIQMKLARSQNNIPEDMIIDRLSPDIETFLQAKQQQYVGSRGHGSMQKENLSRRHSVESFPLNEAASAPKFAVDESSPGSDLHLTERVDAKEIKECSRRMMASESMEPNVVPSKTNDCYTSPISYKMAGENIGTGETNANHVGRNQLNHHNKPAGTCGLNSLRDNPCGNLIRSRSLSSKGDKIRIHSASPCGENSCARSVPTRGSPTPVQSWKFKLSTPEFDHPESSSRLPPGVKENTLMAKLLEARLESSRSRLRPPRGSV